MKPDAHLLEYNRKSGRRLPWIVVIIDEMAPFASQKDGKTELEALVKMCASAGIHIIIATQTMDNKSVPTGITDNLDWRIGLRTKRVEESRRIIGEPGLEQLPMSKKGRGMLKMDEVVEFQSYWIEDETLIEVIQKYGETAEQIKKPDLILMEGA